jgi:hypothetical protein
MDVPNASMTRPDANGTQSERNRKTAEKKDKDQVLHENLRKAMEEVHAGLGICDTEMKDDDAWQRVKESFSRVAAYLKELGRLTQKRTGEEGGMEERIQMVVTKAIAKSFAGLARAHPAGAPWLPSPTNAPRGSKKPLWSEIVGSTKPTVEIRMNPQFNERTLDEKLEKIKETIPDAQAIIPHARAKDKVSVVVPDITKTVLLRNGLKEGAEGIKLVRRPNLAMILGVPLTQRVTTKKSVENAQWIKEFEKSNKTTINRVEWLYSQKMVDQMRDTKSQKRGSLIVETATQDERDKMIREGVIIGAEWFRVTCWDITMKETQCFRCWGWGHSQSVCNAPEELCGYCAGKHSTEKCETKGKEHASCACCKKKGHHAFHRRSCPKYDEFRETREKARTLLMEKTAQICQRDVQGPIMLPPTRAPCDHQWTVVPRRKIGEKQKRASFEDSEEERVQRRGPGRPKGTTAAAMDHRQSKIILQSRASLTPSSSQPNDDAMEIIDPK